MPRLGPDRSAEDTPGIYDVSVNGFPSCTGSCSCDAHGVCAGMASGPVVQSDPATISFPSAGPVEVVFGPCAFGCPDGGV